VTQRRVPISPRSSSPKNLFMQKTQANYAHTSVVGEAPQPQSTYLLGEICLLADSAAFYLESQDEC